jgi:hypothetical protein
MKNSQGKWMTKTTVTKFVFKRCEDYTTSSDIFKRWSNSLDYRKINIEQKNNKLCLSEQEKTNTFALTTPNDKMENRWNLKIRYCKQLENGDQCDIE